MDSRSQYYDSWENRAKAAVAAADDEDAKEKEAADKALALDRTPLSLAEKVDAEAHAALKEAKKHWAQRESNENAQKFIATHDLDTEKKVIVIKSQDREFIVKQELIKLFVEESQNLTIRIEGHIITSFVEISRSKNIHFIAPDLKTLQIDLCDDCTLECPHTKVYHAGCSRLTIQSKLYNDVGKEQQYLTENGVTTLIYASPEKRKELGNECFGNAEYSQAAVHYTVALDALTGQQRAIILANRAACFLKLGAPEKALQDADEAATLHPTYAKAHFRKGLALHAMHHYKDALPELGKALNLEPKNNQIIQALRFAEMRLASQS